MPRQHRFARAPSRPQGPGELAVLLTLTASLAGGCYHGAGQNESASSPTLTAGEDPTETGGPNPAGTDGDPTDGDPTDGGGEAFAPAPARLRLLLARQYRSSVAYLLGDAAAAEVETPPDSAINGFEAIGAAQLALNDQAVDTYEKSARKVAAAADDAILASYHTCVPTGPDDEACHKEFVTNFGRVAWRRSLTQAEIDRYGAVGRDAALAFGSWEAGREYAVAGLLQSPYFLYQVEVGEPDPDDPAQRVLTGVELATRLSFFLLDTTPTRELIDLGEGDGLATADDIRAVAWTMLETPAARAALGGFFAEVLRLRTLEALPKDPATFPAWSPALGAAMREEALKLIDDIAFTREADFRDFLNAPYTFANGPLAALYGLIPDPAVLGDTWQQFDLPVESKRGGLLGQGGFLAAYAHISSTSPTLRGKFVREVLMCQGIPAPPPDVVTELPVGEDYPTMRDRLAEHQTNPSCSGCHKLMDDIGFGLENFDGIGVFRLVENGVTLNTVSTLDGLGEFDGARELGTLLRESPAVTRCLVRNLFRHATGHLEVPGEAGALKDLDQVFEDNEYRMKELLAELVASPAFLRVGTPE
ncbi:Protein of unknown function [Nannocystis exedens]|uniref:DUF1592 domain-containing protein n=1 Tax=Nannocystis exedens TaxID=54 RepID=A0A1I2G0N7_9BACT|nr:DUF1592 domain-containing protein [Nannocystis exedens]PCC74590.1 hypothetical protein NAEX_07687 [Nannocystis exedens]SFF10647.1 Protein of unknown function [Nannocystis exedens]